MSVLPMYGGSKPECQSPLCKQVQNGPCQFRLEVRAFKNCLVEHALQTEGKSILHNVVNESSSFLVQYTSNRILKEFILSF